MKTASLLAKLSAPRLIEVYARARLFDLLDRARRRPVVWIGAPAGAGKTTLVASYAAARKLPAIWYRLDAGDADPATFFYYLRAVLQKHAPRKRETLPLLTPEYLAALPNFARDFFDRLCERLRAPAVLVFDNYQDLPAEAVLHRLLPGLLQTLPPGLNAIVLSREAPAPAFARLQMERAMQTLNAEHLQLTLEEAQGIAALHPHATFAPDVLAELHAKVEGWAAGWVLSLEHARANAAQPLDAVSRGVRNALFDYFATELFERTAPDVQALLLKTSFLTQIAAADAAALSGLTEAPAILADLERRNYLTTRIVAAEPVYQFHPLFREFLLQRARRTLSKPEQQALLQQAAQLLSARAQCDDAVSLLIEGGAWNALGRLIVGQAPALVGQGRLATLETWLRALPPDLLDTAPWLRFWLGVSRMPFALLEARGHFVHAFRWFKQQADARGMYLAWAGIGESYFYSWDDYSDIDPWLDELAALQRAHPLEQFPDTAPRLAAAALLVLSIARPDRPEIAAWVRCMHRMLDSAADPRVLAPVALALAAHHAFNGATDKARLLEKPLEALSRVHDVGPLPRVAACAALVTITRRAGDLDAARRWVAAGLALCEQLGIRAQEAFFCAQACYAEKLDDRPDEVAAYLERTRQALLPGRRMDLTHCHYHAAWLAWRRGDLALAHEYAQQAYAIDAALTAQFPAALAGVMLATILVEQGQYAAAAEHLARLDGFVERTGNVMIGFTAGLVRAWSALRQERHGECEAVLARTFALGREQHDNLIFADWYPRVVTPLVQFALEHDVETDYARTLIRRRRLLPAQPPLHLDNWPWPVKLYTLGRFSILCDDKPLRFEGKAQKKPLELLKALVALGGRDVREDRLVEALWPDNEADAGANALTTAVHRLRKLLGADIVVRGEGRLSLDARYCWVDVWALERTLSALPDACREARAEDVWTATERLLDLYRGEFLRSEPDSPWVLPARERVRSRLLRQLEAAGQCLAQAGRYAEAVLCYDKALEVEPLADSLYRGLIGLHLAQQRNAEALLVYRRCRRMLATHSTLVPSPDIEALARRIGAPA